MIGSEMRGGGARDLQLISAIHWQEKQPQVDACQLILPFKVTTCCVDIDLVATGSCTSWASARLSWLTSVRQLIAPLQKCP